MALGNMKMKYFNHEVTGCPRTVLSNRSKERLTDACVVADIRCIIFRVSSLYEQ